MNILILSAGTRNTIIQYFRETISGKVVAADMSLVAPALYAADRFYQVPRITEKTYIEAVMDICRKENIRAVLSLIDPELSILAANKDRFAALGVIVVGSDYALCERALDKMQMYHWLADHGYLCAKSYSDRASFCRDMEAGRRSFPVFAKPIHGSASIGSHRVEDRKTAELLFESSDDMMVQEYLNGQEIGVDAYVDMISGEAVSIFTKKKILMRAGETDKAVSFKDEKLFALIERFCRESGCRGPIDIDVFAIDGEYYISDVNPRFGGGYPHAHACGCNHIKLIENNINGIVNDRNIGAYEEGVYMMKYSEIMIKREI